MANPIFKYINHPIYMGVRTLIPKLVKPESVKEAMIQIPPLPPSTPKNIDIYVHHASI